VLGDGLASEGQYENGFRNDHFAASDNYGMKRHALFLTCFIPAQGFNIISYHSRVPNLNFQIESNKRGHCETSYIALFQSIIYAISVTLSSSNNAA